MGWHQIAAIYVLSVMAGGVISAGILLWIKRDRPKHAAPRKLAASNAALDYVNKIQQALPGGTPWDERGRLRDLTCPECGIPWRQVSADCPRIVYDLHKYGPAGTIATALDDAIGLSRRVTDFYSQRAERQTQQLLDAGAARWHS